MAVGFKEFCFSSEIFYSFPSSRRVCIEPEALVFYKDRLESLLDPGRTTFIVGRRHLGREVLLRERLLSVDDRRVVVVPDYPWKYEPFFSGKSNIAVLDWEKYRPEPCFPLKIHALREGIRRLKRGDLLVVDELNRLDDIPAIIRASRKAAVWMVLPDVLGRDEDGLLRYVRRELVAGSCDPRLADELFGRFDAVLLDERGVFRFDLKSGCFVLAVERSGCSGLD